MEVADINDLRRRIVEYRKYQEAGESIPEGLKPTDEELREALKAARGNRQTASDAAPKKKAKRKPSITEDTNLNDLFSKGGL